MKFTDTGGFTRHIDVRPIEALKDNFHLDITSYLASAKNPTEPQKLLSLTVDYKGLVAMRNELHSAVLEHNDKED